MTMQTLTIERSYDAPAEKVWGAWTDPEVLARWWAPKGMANTLANTDVREGGLFRYCMSDGEKGVDFHGRGIYRRVEPYSRLSYMDTFADPEGNPVPPLHYGVPGEEVIETLVDVELKEEGEKTLMTVRMENYFDEQMTEHMVAGWNTMFDKLGEQVAA